MNSNLKQQFQTLRQMSGGFRASRVILTANNLEIFEHAKTPKTAVTLAERIKADPRATEILLDAVTALGLLKKSGSKYTNTPLARTFLIKESPWYQGDMLRHSDHLWKNWSNLDEVVRTGQPKRAEGRDYEVFIRAMHNNAVLRAPAIINAIDLKGVIRAIDLGGGPGTYSMELARKKISVTLFDMPEAIEVAKQILAKSKTKNVYPVAGDFHTDDIGKGYDLVFISQILHSLSADDSLGLLKKAFAALNPGGRVAIHEFTLAEDRAHPAPGALFSINMLVNTAGGRCYTPKELRAWLIKAGFKNVKTKVLGETVVVTGKKA
jgi:2-polyprenyl-3-methyl-5-hydroxy-6-metoxy-1,4-benzoquinol methylase